MAHLPIENNEPRYAVVSIRNEIILITGTEAYCRLYASRANEDYSIPRYKHVLYDDLIKQGKVNGLQSLTPPKRVESKPIRGDDSIKGRILAYLKKTS